MVEWVKLDKFYAVFCGNIHTRLWVNNYVRIENGTAGQRIGRITLGVSIGDNVWQVSRVH